MPMFAIRCLDKPDSLALRMQVRPAHVDYLNSKIDIIRIAGPFLGEAGGDPCGSLLIVEVADLAAAQAFADADPYAQAGLFASAEVRPWRLAFGKFG